MAGFGKRLDCAECRTLGPPDYRQNGQLIGLAIGQLFPGDAQPLAARARVVAPGGDAVRFVLAFESEVVICAE